MDKYTFTSVVGALSEAAALAWLKVKYPWYTWSLTKNFSTEDMFGIDVVGVCWTGKIRLIQVKSRDRNAFYYNPWIEILIVPQDDEELYLREVSI